MASIASVRQILGPLKKRMVDRTTEAKSLMDVEVAHEDTGKRIIDCKAILEKVISHPPW